MSLDPKKLVDAIKMFQKKIEKQGRVTNARDEEHLERLLKLYKDMGGKKKFESVNEELNSVGYSQLSRSIKAIAINVKDLAKAHKKQDDSVLRNEIDNLLYDVKRMTNIIRDKKYNESVNEEKNNSENLNIEFGKVVQDFYNRCNQIADKITKLKGDKVDAKIVMKNVKKQVTPLIKLMHSWNKGQQKNPNLTTERKFNHKKSGDNYLGGFNSPKGDTEMFSDKKGRYYIWVKPKGKDSKYIDLPKNVKDRSKADVLHDKIKKTMGESINEAMDKRQAGETLKQLGGNKFIMMTGAKNFAVGPKGMGFKIGRNSKGVNYIRIDLDRGRDLYNMEFIQMRGGNLKVKLKVKGVYNDQLQKMFTKHTGMYTSLGTMGR